MKILEIVPDGASVKITAGKRSMHLSNKDLAHYTGERGRRGNKLPRGLQRVDEVLIEFEAVEAKDNTENNEES